jgi:hypothetical protein
VKAVSKSATLQEARAAKAKVAQLVSGHPAVNGVGITRVGDGYAVKLNLSSPNGTAGLPKQVDGVPVRIETVGPIAKRKRVSSGTAGSSRSSARRA